MRLTGLLLFLGGLMLAVPTRVFAQPLREEAPVPGGTAALSRALGLRGVPDRARFVSELAQIIYAAPHGAIPQADIFARKLTEYLSQLAEGPAVDRPAEFVPIPLPVEVWRDVLRRPVEVSNLFSLVMNDRRAALLSHGLAALDDETLRYLAERPSLVLDLYDPRRVGAFAAFAGSLRIRRQAVVVPGGEAGLAIWEAVVDEKTSSRTPDARTASSTLCVTMTFCSRSSRG